MASTYSANLRLELIGTGEQQGTWGSTTNTNLGSLLEQAIGGYESITVSDVGDTTLTTANGSVDQARNMTLNLVGTIGAARNVICPAAEKIYIVKNSTTGGFAVTFKVTGQTGVSIPNGATFVLYVDGTDVRQATGSVASGGTGTTTSTGTGSVVLSASPTFTGTPFSTTAASNTSTTQIATTAFVIGQANSTAGTIAMNGVQAAGSSALYARADHVHPTDTSRAPLASPAFTGTPSLPTGTTAVTQTAGTNNTTIATTAFVIGQQFPSGTRMLFQQTSAPTGWTKDVSQNDKALRIVSGSVTTGGTTAFSTVFASRTPAGTVGNTIATGSINSATSTGTVGGTALTEAQLPSHRHFIAANDTVVSTPALSASNYVAYRRSDTNNSPNYTLTGTIDADATLGLSGATGSGSTHTHSLTMNSHSHTLTMDTHNHTFTGTALDFAVQYVDVIIAAKD
jgi:hypothetical protein